LYVVNTHELCAIRIEAIGNGNVRALLLAHRYVNDGGDSASPELRLRAGQRVVFEVSVFADLSEANRANFGESVPLRGRMAQVAYRGWTAKTLSQGEYARVADALAGVLDYVIIREIEPHSWIPPLFHRRGLKVWHYQYWGALRWHSAQTPDGLAERIGMRGRDGKLYTAPKSPKGAWLLCDLRRADVRQQLVANARSAIENGYDGLFLDGYPMWPDTTGRRGGSVPGATESLHHARWQLLREIRAACREVREDAVVGVLGNNYYDTQGEADFVLKERMYWCWVKFDRQFDRRETRVQMDLGVAFEQGEAPYAGRNVAYGFKGYSPLAVQSARHFVRRPTGLDYFGTGDFFPQRLDEWLATLRAIVDERERHITRVEPPTAFVCFRGRDTLSCETACMITLSTPCCFAVTDELIHQVKQVALRPGVRCRLVRGCTHPR